MTGIYPSPFEYREQAILAVPSDVPAPNVNAAGHFSAFARVTLDLAEAADGGMFVLFTSHRDIRAMAAELRARGVERRWPLLVHGDETRDALLDRFRDAGKAILLGTASFWEGVDVPGDALHALLIAKLPFRCRPSRSPPRTAKRSRRAAEIRSASTCCRTPRCASNRDSAD